MTEKSISNREGVHPRSLTLSEFTAEVNKLYHEECARLNANPNKLFGAEHFDYPEIMLSLYYDQGLTPAETKRFIDEEAEQEGRFEAMVS